MNNLTPDFSLLILGFVVLISDLIFRKSDNKFSSLSFHLSWLGLLTILGLTFCPELSFGETSLPGWVLDKSGLMFRRIFLLGSLLTVLFSRAYFVRKMDNQAKLTHSAEFYSLILFITFGMTAMVSATNLLGMFIGLELATIPLYVLSAYNKKDSKSSEAAMKYIIMGSASTAFMLFSFSYLYGITGTLSLDAITQAVATNTHSPLLWISVVMLFAGIGFKLTLFPFHMWAPDVYHGSPTPTTAFLSVSSKATAIAFLMQMVYGPLAPIHDKIQYLILLLAGFTMTVGNLGAMKQKHLRRFMAYSSIAQAGYLLMTLAGPAELGKAAVMFYFFIYAVTNYAAFFIIAIVGESRGEDFKALRGLGKQSPALAGILAVAMFSLAGIPPVAGFLGKFFLFGAIAAEGYYAFIIFAALNSTVSLYYYLIILKEAYIKPTEGELSELKVDWTQRLTLGILLIAVLALGLVPWFSTTIANAL